MAAGAGAVGWAAGLPKSVSCGMGLDHEGDGDSDGDGGDGDGGDGDGGVGVGVVAFNGLAARVECSLGPGVLGGEMALANDDRGLRVVVKKASRKASRSGVKIGDVLLSLNARALPPKLDAGELMALLRGNPRYMLSPVDACLWRQHLPKREGKYAVAGFRDGAAGVEFRRVDGARPAAAAVACVESHHWC